MRVDQVVTYQAQQRPENLALQQDGERLSYGEVDSRANQMANGLSALGVERGDRVAIVCENCIDEVLLILASAKIGAVAVTLNYRLATPEIEYILRDACAKVVVVPDTQFVDAIAGITESLPQTIFFGLGDSLPEDWLHWTQWWTEHDPRPLTPVTDVNDAFIQLYTSGTTGRPKGAVLSHRNLVDLAMCGVVAAENRPSIGDKELVMAPLFHIGAVAPLFYSMMIGVSVIIQRSFNPLAVVDAIEAYQLKSLFMVPAMIQALVATVPNIESRDFSSLRRINYGASPINEALLQQALAIFGCDFQQSYGMTETAGAFCQLTVNDHRKAVNGRPELLASCGRPNPASEMKIVDGQGNALGDGELGEIIVKSTTNMMGYWRQPEKTAETLKDGWLYTGDVGYRDKEGYYYLKDRMKDMVVSGGENIYPNEVERVLIRHPAITDVAVIGVPDQQYGEALLACCVLTEKQALDEESIISYCREHLAGYKIPRRYQQFEELPRNLSGKILKTVLREPHWKSGDRQIG